ncbi:MAG: hypothetical protein LBI38_04885 [Oscillospiraceae bacterium]|jgi:hypothetical protein|nr:hypothetical protein [Oscillospiraceae bacterium]
MIYSELSKLDGELGLAFNADDLALTGKINGYDAIIADDKRAGEFILAVFAEAGSGCDFHALYETMPKNAVNSLNFGKTAVFAKFSAYLTSQENLPLLLEAANVITNALSESGREPSPAEKSAVADLKAAPADQSSPRLPLKPALLGALGAVIGAFAGFFVSIILAQINHMIFSWLNGALIAVMTISNFIFLAKGIDKRGIIVCSCLTLATILAAAFSLPSIAFANHSRGVDLSVLLKSPITASAASAAFYALYFTPRTPES